MTRYYLVRGKKGLRVGRMLAHRGEARVYLVEGMRWVFKKWHKPDRKRNRKLVALIKKPPRKLILHGKDVQLAWPLDLVQDQHGQVIGFVMPLIPHSKTLYSFIHSSIRLQEFDFIATYRNVVNVLRNLCSLFHAIHRTDRYVICDINSENFHVDLSRGLVSALDIDSWQVKTKRETFLCRVYTPDYSAPEVFLPGALKKSRTKRQDAFGLALLVYHGLLDSHPYSGVYNRDGIAPTIPDRIRQNNLAYSRYGSTVATDPGWLKRLWAPTATLRDYTPSPTAFPLETLSEELRELFFQFFFYGHSDIAARPSVGELFDALDCFQRELTQCKANKNHLFYEELDNCPWCQYGDQHQFDPFPLEK